MRKKRAMPVRGPARLPARRRTCPARDAEKTRHSAGQCGMPQSGEDRGAWRGDRAGIPDAVHPAAESRRPPPSEDGRRIPRAGPRGGQPRTRRAGQDNPAKQADRAPQAGTGAPDAAWRGFLIEHTADCARASNCGERLAPRARPPVPGITRRPPAPIPAGPKRSGWIVTSGRPHRARPGGGRPAGPGHSRPQRNTPRHGRSVVPTHAGCRRRTCARHNPCGRFKES